MSVVETVLVYAVIPLAIYGVVTLWTMREKFARTPRYRPGQSWEYPPVWWTANPAGVGADHVIAGQKSGSRPGARTAKGGARGKW